jgi:hypothetical protein
MRRRVLTSISATVIAICVVVGAFAAPAFAGVNATGVITCSMITSTTSVGSITHGLGSTGTATHVTVKFKVTFKCNPFPPVATPLGVSVAGGTLVGVAKYVAASTSQPANTCVDFNGIDKLTVAKVGIKWIQTPATPAISPTKIKYLSLGAGTVAGNVITLKGMPPGTVTKAGSFSTPNPPNTVKLVTGGFACPVAAPLHTPFIIIGGTINI